MSVPLMSIEFDPTVTVIVENITAVAEQVAPYFPLTRVACRRSASPMISKLHRSRWITRCAPIVGGLRLCRAVVEAICMSEFRLTRVPHPPDPIRSAARPETSSPGAGGCSRRSC